MTEDVKPELIKRTQDTLGKYVKKPPLTEKLLKKPPFRFLHDIVTTVVRETGFLQGLFSADELNHENIKDRESKVAFLQKLIDAIKTITGISLTVRPTKIVAGHEPTKTNELLQAIGKALDKKLSSLDYVDSLGKKSKAGSKENAPKTKTAVQSKTISQVRTRSQDRTKTREQEKPQDRIKTKDQDKKKVSKSTTGTKVKEKTAKSIVTKEETPQLKQREVKEGEVKQQEVTEQEARPPLEEQNNTGEETQLKAQSPQTKDSDLKRPQSARPGHRKPSADVSHRTPADNTGADATQRTEPEVKVEPQVLGADLPSSQTEPTNEEVVAEPKPAHPKTSMRPQSALRPPSARVHSARPPSARPAAPRIRDRGEIAIVEEVSSSPVGKVNVITENIAEQDEDDNFVVVESQAPIIVEEQTPQPVLDTKPIEEGEHGHLVAQILETQKELEEDSHHDGQPKKIEIDWEAGRRRERELASREIERVRSSIQTLTRAANPLGKLMDFLQEDVDSMQRELEMWQHTNADLQAQLRTEQMQTQQTTEPMKFQLQQLEANIEEQLNQLSALKATVLRNDQRIYRLLTGEGGPA